MTTDPHLYQALLGETWAALPAVTRALHAPDPVACFEGEPDIERGRHPLARLCAALLGLPEAGKGVPTRVRVGRVAQGELLERWYDGRRFATLQTARGDCLDERFGPFRLSFRLEGGEDGIVFRQRSVALCGLPLPAALAPRIEASERAEGDTHLFDVCLSLPGIGEIVRYRGRLRLTAS